MMLIRVITVVVLFNRASHSSYRGQADRVKLLMRGGLVRVLGQGGWGKGWEGVLGARRD